MISKTLKICAAIAVFISLYYDGSALAQDIGDEVTPDGDIIGGGGVTPGGDIIGGGGGAPCGNGPHNCDKNEIWIRFPKCCRYNPTCRTRFGGATHSCPPSQINKICKSKCFCKPGYVEIGKKCLKEKYCPPYDTCRTKREIFSPNGFEWTCLNYNRRCFVRPIPGPGCFCRPGYYRRNDGECVRGCYCLIQPLGVPILGTGN